MSREISIAPACWTAIGTFGGGLKDVPLSTLGAVAAREAIKRAGIDGVEVQTAVFENVIHTEPRDMYISRIIAMEAGAPNKRRR